MLAMTDRSRKPRKPSGARKPPKRTGVPLHIYIDPALRDALNKLCDKTRRLLTTEVVIALENHLQAAELWPPPEGPQEK